MMFRRSSVFLAAAVLAGCAVVDRARRTQEEVAPRASETAWTNNVPVSVSFSGCALSDYVDAAFVTRPAVRSAELAVSNAVVEIALLLGEAPGVAAFTTSAGYDRSTLNKGVSFSSHSDGDPFGKISVDVLICDFGRYDAKERAAREKLLAAQQELRGMRLQVFREVAKTYFALLRRDALVAAAQMKVEQYRAHLEQAELLYANSENKKLDVLRARLDLATARVDLLSASNDVLTAEAEFKSALGLEPGAATRQMLLPPASNALEKAEAELDVSTFDGAEGLARARAGAPQLLAARAKLRAASADVDAAVADLWPKLSFGTALSAAGKTWNWSWAATVLDTFSTARTKTVTVEKTALALRSAEADLAIAENELGMEIAVALANRDTAQGTYRAACVKVDQARENLDAANAQYAEGDLSRVDFKDAVADYAQALGERTDAFYAGQTAESELMYLTGTPPVYVNRSARRVSQEETK